MPTCPVFGIMSCDTCCLPDLSAIVDRFVETRATTGNKISDKSGQWPKQYMIGCLSCMENIIAFILPSGGLQQTVQMGQKFGGR